MVTIVLQKVSPALLIWRIVALLVTLTLLFAGVYPSAITTTHATDHGIRVTSDLVQVNFPHEVMFTLEAEAQTEIEKVTLFYKGAPSDIWNYSYPTFTPGRQVEVTFSLNISGGQYLPSGADMVYFYAIKDSQGRVTETEERLFTYLDNRFEWQTTKVGPLTILWHDLSEGRVNRVAQQVASSLNRIRDLLGNDSEAPIKGVIYNTMSEARLVFPNQSQTTTREGVFQGYAFPQWGVFLGVGFQTNLITHEAAHLLLSQVTGSPGAFVPAWVDEGFASYVAAGARVPRYNRGFPQISERRSMPLRTMSTIPGKVRDIRTFYSKAESMVGFMVEELGADKFRSFLHHLDQMKTTDDALRAAYGFNINDLDNLWAAASGVAGTAPDGRSFPYWALNSIILGSLVLLVSTLIVVRAAFKRLRKSPEPLEDGGDEFPE